MHEIPPPVQMVQMLAGFQVAQGLYTCAKLGIPDQLTDGPRTPAQLATSVQADPASTLRLVRTLASLGVFADAGDGRFALTPLGWTLVSDAPGSMRDLALMWMETHYAAFGELVEGVKSGRPAADLYYGVPFFQWLSGEPEQIHRFTRAMANLTTGIKNAAAAEIDLTGAHTVVDVGGADGAVLAQLLERDPNLEGIVLDLPHVVQDAEAAMKAHGFGPRLRSLGGDFFQSVPEADAYVLSMILHDWDDESARRILANIARDGRPGSRVISLELVIAPGDQPHMAKMIDLTMLGMLTGRERTAEELEALVSSAGLHFDGITATPSPMSLLQASVTGN
jgi:O-methyltransferase domain/Dimerisation domain